jgi:ubiquitin-conjugating enzyme E2 I
VWHGFVPGPRRTPFEGGLYVVRLVFPSDYPGSAPTCTFVPPLFHPNVTPGGVIMLKMLDDEHWDPHTTIKNILMGARAATSHHALSDSA